MVEARCSLGGRRGGCHLCCRCWHDLGSPCGVYHATAVPLEECPTGSRQTVTARVAEAGTTVQRWGKLGYDLEEQSDYEGHAENGRTRDTSHADIRQEVDGLPGTPQRCARRFTSRDDNPSIARWAHSTLTRTRFLMQHGVAALMKRLQYPISAPTIPTTAGFK